MKQLSFFLIASFVSQLSSVLGDMRLVAEIYGNEPSCDKLIQLNSTYQINGCFFRFETEIGNIMRKQYITERKFLDEEFNSSQIFYQMSNQESSHRTAIHRFNGFYPFQFRNEYLSTIFSPNRQQKKGDRQIQVNHMKYLNLIIQIDFIQQEGFFFEQSEDVFSLDKINKDILKCREELFKQNTNADSLVEELMKNTLQLLSIHNNTPVLSLETASSIYQSINQDQAAGKYIQIDFDIMTNLTFINSYYQFSRVTPNSFFGTIMEERLLNQLFDRFINILSTNSPLKWLSYSGSLNNVVHLLSAFNSTSSECLYNQQINKNQALNCVLAPSITSSLIIEIYDRENEEEENKNFKYKLSKYYLKIKYNQSYLKLCERDSTICDFDEFFNRLKTSISSLKSKSCSELNKKNRFLRSAIKI